MKYPYVYGPDGMERIQLNKGVSVPLDPAAYQEWVKTRGWKRS